MQRTETNRYAGRLGTMIHTAQLDLSQFGSDDDTHKPVWLDVWNYWNTHGYPIESIVEAHTAIHKKPDDEDTSHVVLKVETLSKPLDEADVAADTIQKYACDCKGFEYHYSTDLAENRIAEWGVCPHIESVDPTIKAKSDDAQTSL